MKNPFKEIEILEEAVKKATTGTVFTYKGKKCFMPEERLKIELEILKTCRDFIENKIDETNPVEIEYESFEPKELIFYFKKRLRKEILGSSNTNIKKALKGGKINGTR